MRCCRDHETQVCDSALDKRKAPTLVGAPPTGNKAQPEARAALAARADRESPAHLLASVAPQPNDFKVRKQMEPCQGAPERGQTKGPVSQRGPSPIGDSPQSEARAVASSEGPTPAPTGKPPIHLASV